VRGWVQGQIEAMRARDVVETEHLTAAANAEIAAWLPRLGVRPPADFRATYDDALDHAVPRSFQRFGLEVLIAPVP
jgi:hypothetical protein